MRRVLDPKLPLNEIREPPFCAPFASSILIVNRPRNPGGRAPCAATEDNFMPRKRRNPKIRRAELPDYVVWWLKTGGILDLDECRAAGFDNPKDAAWGIFILHFGDEPPTVAPHVWTRQRLREAGYGADADAIEERERAEAADDAA